LTPAIPNLLYYSSSSPPASPSVPTRRSSHLAHRRRVRALRRHPRPAPLTRVERAGRLQRRWQSCASTSARWARARVRWRCRSTRSEEHTSELQSRENLVCRLLLEKKNKIKLT